MVCLGSLGRSSLTGVFGCASKAQSLPGMSRSSVWERLAQESMTHVPVLALPLTPDPSVSVPPWAGRLAGIT